VGRLDIRYGTCGYDILEIMEINEREVDNLYCVCFNKAQDGRVVREGVLDIRDVKERVIRHSTRAYMCRSQHQAMTQLSSNMQNQMQNNVHDNN
jgi:predicted RecA/RadA family phage recombinase